MSQFKVALAGNPNSGKSTVFNALTGSKQIVGNWAGVTVEKKTGSFSVEGSEFNVIDLPGIYSLSSYSIDEQIARDFLLSENPDIVVAVVDASNLERNLYFVSQLLEMGNRVVIALNMIDVALERNIRINSMMLSKLLKLPVVKMVANQEHGVKKLKKVIAESAHADKNILRIDYGNEVEEVLKKLSIEFDMNSLEDRFYIIRALEGDEFFLDMFGNKNKELLLSETNSLSQILDDDLDEFLIEKRYGYIHGLVKKVLHRTDDIHSKIDFSDKIDRFVTNRFLGIPLFFFVMWAVFQIVFTVGAPVSDIVGSIFDGIAGILRNFLAGHTPELFISFLTDGIIGGLGAILVFVPNIFILFMAISILEDSGYMARAAFVMDKFMSMFGLHGKSFIPMILGFGCSIPGIMAARTLESRKDRILTILVLPLMSCSARFPIYTLFVGIFFKNYRGSIVFSLYLIGIVLAIIMARLFKSMFFKDENTPLIMELPPYHLPNWKLITRYSWYRTSMFIKKAGTVILGGVLVIWLLASLPAGIEYGSENSFIGMLGNIIAPIFKPAGFGFWQASVSLLFGIMAKEVVVGTLGTLYGSFPGGVNAAIANVFNPISAYSFMLMSLIYVPCIAAISAIKQEIGWKWALFNVIYTLFLGWGIAVIFYQVAMILIK